MTTDSLLLEVRVLMILVMLWARDWVLWRDTLEGRAATVAKFMYRLMSVGLGLRLDTPLVHISWVTLGSSLALMSSQATLARCWC